RPRLQDRPGNRGLRGRVGAGRPAPRPTLGCDLGRNRRPNFDRAAVTPLPSAMALSPAERKLCDLIEARGDRLLADLHTHVGLPTGHNNTEAIERTRSLLTSRLAALGAGHERIPGDPKPKWLHESGAGGAIPDASICARTDGRLGARILIAGHMDTVHDPAGDFKELIVDPDGRRAT